MSEKTTEALKKIAGILDKGEKWLGENWQKLGLPGAGISPQHRAKIQENLEDQKAISEKKDEAASRLSLMRYLNPKTWASWQSRDDLRDDRLFANTRYTSKGEFAPINPRYPYASNPWDQYEMSSRAHRVNDKVFGRMNRENYERYEGPFDLAKSMQSGYEDIQRVDRYAKPWLGRTLRDLKQLGKDVYEDFRPSNYIPGK